MRKEVQLDFVLKECVHFLKHKLAIWDQGVYVSHHNHPQQLSYSYILTENVVMKSMYGDIQTFLMALIPYLYLFLRIFN